MQVEQNQRQSETGPATLAITFETPELMIATLGPNDELLRILTGAYPDVQFRPNGSTLSLLGDPVQVRKAQRVTEEARSLGMVYDIVEDGEALQAAAVALARRFGEASTAAIGMAKTAMNQAFELDARAMAELEAYAQTMCRGSDYHQEAVQRFKDKQPTRFDWDRAP